jgi:hypothetical protein
MIGIDGRATPPAVELLPPCSRLRAQLGYTLLPPHLSFYLMVAGGLAVSLGIIASTLPLLRWITGPETARNE